MVNLGRFREYSNQVGLLAFRYPHDGMEPAQTGTFFHMAASNAITTGG